MATRMGRDDMGHETQLFMRPEKLREWIPSRWERIIGAARATKPDINTPYARFRAFLEACEESGKVESWPD